MTTCNLIWDAESSQTGKTQQSNTASSPALYVVSSTVPDEAVTPDGSISLENFLGEFADDKELQQVLPAKRRALAEALYSDEPETFTFLRLNSGLSQAELAQRAGTTQSYIARIEKGAADPSTAMIERLTRALGIDDAALTFCAVTNQRRTRGAK